MAWRGRGRGVLKIAHIIVNLVWLILYNVRIIVLFNIKVMHINNWRLQFLNPCFMKTLDSVYDIALSIKYNQLCVNYKKSILWSFCQAFCKYCLIQQFQITFYITYHTNHLLTFWPGLKREQWSQLLLYLSRKRTSPLYFFNANTGFLFLKVFLNVFHRKKVKF